MRKFDSAIFKYFEHAFDEQGQTHHQQHAKQQVTEYPTRQSSFYKKTYCGASIASGIMTSSLAMPGPVAMWALARKGIKAEQIRATLRGLFVISYALALVAHALNGMDWVLVIDSSLDLGIALAAGTAIGFFVKSRLPGWVLSNLLLGMLLVMGLSLFVKSMLEIF